MDNLVEFVASRLDNTILRFDVDKVALLKFFEDSVSYGVRGVVVHPSMLEVLGHLPREKTKLVSVVAFPFGYTGLDVKLKEVDYCIEAGADELDVVLNIFYIKEGELDKFRDEARAIVTRVRDWGEDIVLKTIVEVTLLDREELDAAIGVINEVRPDFFKTSTGYGPRGTESDDVRFIKSRLDPDIGIKAAGSVASLDKFMELVEAGADVIGASRGFDILREAEARE